MADVTLDNDYFFSGVRGKDVMVERKIIGQILDGYNVDIRPEIEHGVPMHVHFEMKLQKIVRLVSL